jgi:restriction system protein
MVELKEDRRIAQHLRFINPLLIALRTLGGSGKTSEVADKVIESLALSEKQLEETISTGQLKVYNQIGFARLFLCQTGFITDTSGRGVWSLTEKGLNVYLSDEELKYLDKRRRQNKKVISSCENNIQIGQNLVKDQKYNYIDDLRAKLLAMLKSMHPQGFEKLCQRLLRELNFDDVEVTGKSGDGGIDGRGTLRISPFLSFKVVFQCKRFQGLVRPSHVRELRGAMSGRADKGVLITTGEFSREAKKEARREGVPPIEPIDGQSLVNMFVELKIGLKIKESLEIDTEFFDSFSR